MDNFEGEHRMRIFAKILFGTAFMVLLACSIQATFAENIPIKGLFVSQGEVELVTTEGTNYQIYLQTIIRNADGQLVNVTESTANGAYVPHMLSDHVFDTLMSEKEIITIDGIDYEKGNTSFEFGKCCKPNPKNEIIGLLNNNQVIMIHKSNCYVLKRILNSERKLSLTWNVADEIGANLVVQAEDRIGLLRDISEAVSSENVNISNISLNPQDHSTIKISFSLDSMNLVSLDNIIGKIELLIGVKNVIVKND